MANERFSDKGTAGDVADLESAAMTAAEKARQRLDGARRGLTALQQTLDRIKEVTGTLQPVSERLSDMTLSAAREVVHAGAAGRSFLALVTQLGEIACQSATALRRLETCVRQSAASLQYAIAQAEQANWQVEEIMPALKTMKTARESAPIAVSFAPDTDSSEQEPSIFNIWPSPNRGPAGSKN